MEIEFKEGNILESNADFICHQVNCQGVMGSGVAKQIVKKYPKVFDSYKSYIEKCSEYNIKILGTAEFIPVENEFRYIVNLFGQDKYGYDGKRYTSYDAIYDSLVSAKEEISKLNPTGIVAFPYNMSSVRGGANWNIILKMIEEVFKNTNNKINIYKL